ncbi:hypothetical protein GCM10027169_31410 [Gordonia jinhuaensis]|uniref:HTH arsR-type domain-containing protein n=1 Tax=Gordonia jinhuaensis TaxID=1517702 RepID=A0A916WUF8_9ACTN|nr:metalloregulator ArsR/SmtB family transcription factor [Gordonia jinhuaensis]GGB33626.1 hypothetical protein GCM10011489_22210 [Gordonia jinhuaensis]
MTRQIADPALTETTTPGTQYGRTPTASESADDFDRPLYEIKANLFKGLAHPIRIRVLEIIVAGGDDPTPVSELLRITGTEPTLLSQHLAVLKRNNVVTSTRVGNAAYYRVAHPMIPELLVIARQFLADSLGASRDQLGAMKSLPPLSGGTSGLATSRRR